MTNKRTLIVANWKMNLNTSQASILLHRLHERIRIHRDIEVVLAPSMLVLQPLSVQIDRRKFRLAAQNAHHKDEGAYTGEVSFTMLQDLVHYAIVGHSERRIYFNESLEDTRDKVAAALRNDITPILCVGETEVEHKNKETRQVLHDQIVTALSNVSSSEIKDIVIAYEPVWAIGSGKVAEPKDVEQVTSSIYDYLVAHYDRVAAESVEYLYGGSVDAGSVTQFVGKVCNGALIGGASNTPDGFFEIISRFNYSKPKPKPDF